ncbi:MAG: ribonuclease HII [Spirochaetes bacterium GWD1_27_9]|nr:MAG: ribonuclease HII [Spirochaetes bacterium GWB1_27_13]OHD24388.1 MAG: ribonuclease HII [Spirochaetes bacterium GWC1_27_15]OHD33662.1 MAG: ribonuclease HII [Spirochaetes bacterium GWD1_27_9]
MDEILFEKYSGQIIVGIDEAGRGPLAGRVYAGAVILDKNNDIKGLDDSKKLSAEKRTFLYNEIKSKALAYGIGFATNEEVDNINILQATFLAMQRALDQIKVKFDYVLVDGNKYPFQIPGEAIVKGDSKIEAIMAASILAKVERDLFMDEMDSIYPQYQFKQHKGYPTKLHIDLIKKYGPSPIHRRTFKGVKEYIWMHSSC